ncbi:DNA internalization-related competence protein ComEC/Rec2 [Deinococcus maricopensis DSM 21211]|uniref:DNA internalization-related competence protein ComEC/Rec2 n=1 Tax=Deinococcus maricopensis (strain DSM 21211 / LMG 22137 / NRRL B-23946 / LB-34) TaxID=709986 RepID=E8U5T6_DEIML|nr:DNA internalization-related competence protein ComEC/Rec2 [Deinococcus maricopensis DSM 21211]
MGVPRGPTVTPVVASAVVLERGRRAFLPWPVVGALALMAGVLVAFGAWWGALLLAVVAGAAAWVRAPALMLVALVCFGVGFARERAWWAAPDVMTPWVGARVTLSGEWDGQFLRLADPPARVSVRPKPRVDPGRVTVAGVLVRPEGRRTPGGFDEAFWLRTSGVRTVLVGARGRAYAPEAGVRGWFRRGLNVGLSARQAALMEAVELGDRSDIGREAFEDGVAVREAFNRAGLAHLMALSGQNVALLLGALAFVLVRSPVARVRAWLLVPALGAYWWLVGESPSVDRACLMALAVLLGTATGRGRLDVYGVIGLAAMASLALHPAWLFDVGFQLSFLAVLALTLTPRVAAMVPRLGERHRVVRALVYGAAATLLAEAATLPVVAHTFGTVPLVGLPANLVAELIMGALVPLGFLAGLLGPLAVVVNPLVGVLADALLAVAQAAGRAPVLTWGNVSAAGFAAYGVFALAGVLAVLGRVRPPAFLAVAGVLALGTLLPAHLSPPRDITYLDVGQGDSTLIRANGLRVLIDGGGSPGSDFDVGARTVVPALRALGVRALDVVVATHADADHVEGLTAVLNTLPVGELWVGHRHEADPVLRAVLDAARARGVRVREVRRGDHVQAGDVALNVLWPRGAPWSAADNDNSVAVRLEALTFRTAFLGDLPSSVEDTLGLGRLSVLKLAHHGSRHSSSAALLRETAPADAIISVGRNTYGHPHGDVLDRLAGAHVRAWRTDQLGTVTWPIP